MLVTALDYDDYKGKYAIGRITRGRVRPGMTVARIARERQADPWPHQPCLHLSRASGASRLTRHSPATSWR